MITRRHLLLSTAGMLAARPALAAADRPTLCIFSKHMAQFAPPELGRKAKEMGFEGVDLTVRPKGHVLPERVAQDLPRAVEDIRAHGLLLPMITTELTRASDPAAAPTFQTAAQLKIPRYKIGYYRYKGADPERAIAEVREAVLGLLAISSKAGIEAGMHNHSGDYVGTAVWDTRAILTGLDPRWIGYYFDPCHATIEGGAYNWQVSFGIAAPRLKMVAIKDFYWEKQNGKWKVRYCPLGQGMVDWPKFFGMLAAAKFTGPLTLHIEYEAADELQAIANDLAFMRKEVDRSFRAAGTA